MKKILLISFLGLLVTGCQNNETDTTTIEFNTPINYTYVNDIYSFDFIDSDQTKFDNLYTELKYIDINNIAAITTSTANLLYEIGITPVGVSSSESLNDYLKDRRCNSHTSIVNITGFEHCDDVENGIQVIGDGTGTNNEILALLNPSKVFYSSSLPSGGHGGEGSGVANLNNVVALNQSDFIDPFIILDVFNQLAIDTNNSELINNTNNLIKKMIKDLEETESIVSKVEGETSPTVVVIQAIVGGDTFLLNNESAPGLISHSIGLNNVFGNETDSISLSIESLLMSNPDYLLIVGMGGTSNDAIYSLESEMRDSISKFRTLNAVKNNNIITSEMSVSLDLNIASHLKEIAKQVYES